MRNWFRERLVPLLFALLTALLLWPAAAGQAAAHPLNNGYSQITVHGGSIGYELTIPAPSLLAFDMNGNGELSPDELDARKRELADYVLNGVKLEGPDGQLEASVLGMELTEKAGIPAVLFHLRYTAARTIDSFTIGYTLLFDDADPLHLNFVVITNGGDFDQTVLDANNRMYHYRTMAGASMWSSAWTYLLLGVQHILTGYDHLLFLLSLILAARKLGDIVKIVTAFTVAHSMTLILAATGHLTVESRWIEAGIALTIAYVAVENMITRSVRLRWLVTFAFGLVHGLGFAGAIGEIGLPRQYAVSSLVAFNVGVEAGQFAVVVVVLPYLLKLQRHTSYRRVAGTISACVLAIALYWLAERIGLFG